MDKLKQELIERALKKHQKIKPCGNKASLLDCFTEHHGKLIFWYNTEEDSTYVLIEPINKPQPLV